MSRQSQRISEINFSCSVCSKCALHKNRKVHISGDGAVDPDILLVVDRTSVRSAVTGNIFAGKEGSVLNQFIRWSDIDPRFLYVAPSVACPTETTAPKAREKEIYGAPKAAAIKSCRVHLHEKVRALEPNILIAMGPSAVEALRGESNFTQAKGRIIEANIIGVETDYKLPMMVIDSVITLLRTAQNPCKIWNKNLAYMRWASAVNQQLKRIKEQ